MAEPNANDTVNHSRFALGAAVALLAGTFGFAIPLTAYICQGLSLIYDAPLTRGSQLIISVSPWLPLLIALIGCTTLFMKESRISPAASLKWNRAAIIIVVFIGGFSLFVCIVQIISLISAGLGGLW